MNMTSLVPFFNSRLDTLTKLEIENINNPYNLGELLKNIIDNEYDNFEQFNGVSLSEEEQRLLRSIKNITSTIKSIFLENYHKLNTCIKITFTLNLIDYKLIQEWFNVACTNVLTILKNNYAMALNKNVLSLSQNISKQLSDKNSIHNTFTPEVRNFLITQLLPQNEDDMEDMPSYEKRTNVAKACGLSLGQVNGWLYNQRSRARRRRHQKLPTNHKNINYGNVNAYATGDVKCDAFLLSDAGYEVNCMNEDVDAFFSTAQPLDLNELIFPAKNIDNCNPLMMNFDFIEQGNDVADPLSIFLNEYIFY